MLNNYARGPQIGKGQHGAVYQGWDMDNDGREVAIKAVKRKNVRAEKMKLLRRSHQFPNTPHTRLTDKLGSTEQKIRKEIAIMRKCRHAHVVELLDVIDDALNEKIYMVMEYLGGGELKWRNSNEEPLLLVDQTRRICRDVTLGLEYLHYQGIIHRDIKPANLLWTHDRRAVKITDFGVSHFSYAQRLAAVGRGQAELDDPNDPILLDDSDLLKRSGTPPFLAPEVVSEYNADDCELSPPDACGSNPMLSLLKSVVGSRSPSPAPPTPTSTSPPDPQIPPRPNITKAIDVWALGVTIYCLLFGHTPFSTSDGEYVLYGAICNKDWDVPETMGADRITTGGRRARGKSSDGAVALKMLERMLQKDVKKRITLDEIKRSSWLLSDIPDRDRWLRDTNPSRNAAVVVTDSDASRALSTTRVNYWNWSKRVTGKLTTLLRPRSRPSSPLSPDDQTKTLVADLSADPKGRKSFKSIRSDSWHDHDFPTSP